MVVGLFQVVVFLQAQYSMCSLSVFPVSEIAIMSDFAAKVVDT